MVNYVTNIRNWVKHWWSSRHLAVKMLFLPLLNNPPPCIWLAHKVPQVVIGDDDPSCLLSQMKQEPVKTVIDQAGLRERTWGLYKLCTKLPSCSWNNHKWSIQHLFFIIHDLNFIFFHTDWHLETLIAFNTVYTVNICLYIFVAYERQNIVHIFLHFWCA